MEKFSNDYKKASNSLWHKSKIKSILKKGLYEVWFTMINDIEKGEAYWIRYTLLVPKYDYIIDDFRSIRASLWFAYFNANDSTKNFIAKKSFPLGNAKGSYSNSKNEYIIFTLNESKINLDGIKGEFKINENKIISWDLKFSNFKKPFFPIPKIAKWLKITTTLLEITHPNINISGIIKINDNIKQFEKVPGEQTHTYGREYTDEKIWMHSHTFINKPNSWLEFGYKTGKGTLGFFDGNKLYSLNKLTSTFNFEIIKWTPTEISVSYKDKKLEILIDAEVKEQDLIGVVYKGPENSLGYVYNTLVGNLTLKIKELNSESDTIKERKFIAEKSLSMETHWLEPKKSLKLLHWDDSFVER